LILKLFEGEEVMISRYSLEEMSHLWLREETRFEFWWKVELAVLHGMVMLGQLAEEGYEAIQRHARISVQRIKRIENIVDHDVIAFVTDAQRSLATAKVPALYYKRVHEPVTSYDIVDPALILMLREAIELCLIEQRLLRDALYQRAWEHRGTVMIFRTHGQYAQPSTLGHLLMIYAEAVQRSIGRLERVFEHELAEGKISGAVGNYAEVDPMLERHALQQLGLRPALAESQILQRDRHAAVVAVLAIAACTIEQMAITFWKMMSSEVGELREPRKTKQKGSSAMPHKRNPILTERFWGLVRI
jgi:adenylosuccinate lyase